MDLSENCVTPYPVRNYVIIKSHNISLYIIAYHQKMVKKNVIFSKSVK